jgi:Zn-finger nucleic acid-binding protein
MLAPPTEEDLMHCPRCHTAELVERDRSGVLIDICTGCRGVWLDRGELDKLIALEHRPANERDDDDDDDDDRDDGRRGRRRWWEIFD